jgi:hypothetical protein
VFISLHRKVLTVGVADDVSVRDGAFLLVAVLRHGL